MMENYKIGPIFLSILILLLLMYVLETFDCEMLFEDDLKRTNLNKFDYL